MLLLLHCKYQFMYILLWNEQETPVVFTDFRMGRIIIHHRLYMLYCINIVLLCFIMTCTSEDKNRTSTCNYYRAGKTKENKIAFETPVKKPVTFYSDIITNLYSSVSCYNSILRLIWILVFRELIS